MEWVLKARLVSGSAVYVVRNRCLLTMTEKSSPLTIVQHLSAKEKDEQRRAGPLFLLLRKQAIYINLVLSANEDLAINDDRRLEWHGVGGGVSCRVLLTIVELR
jgi:hypothetical protein